MAKPRVETGLDHEGRMITRQTYDPIQTWGVDTSKKDVVAISARPATHNLVMLYLRPEAVQRLVLQLVFWLVYRANDPQEGGK